VGTYWLTTTEQLSCSRSKQPARSHSISATARSGGAILLREDEFSEGDRQRLRKLRNFDALYQQNPAGMALPKILTEHFVLQPLTDNESIPTVVSIDPGQAEGEWTCHACTTL
jgi:hypothetical protein